jgi:uncharacterized membrane protein YozB (DUF420 family)
MSDPQALGETLAAVNAGLNSLSAVFLLAGYGFAKAHNRAAHKKCMVSALGVSAVFLVCYLTRFWLTGAHRYSGEGPLRIVYFGMLFSHMTLAAATPPLALRAAWLATKGRIAEHRRLVRYAWPVWLYVSITGVLVYLMLYRL